MDGCSSAVDNVLRNIGNSYDYSRLDAKRFMDTKKRAKPRNPATNQQDVMKSEEERLKTFDRWPNSEAISPVELAKAGFFYFLSGDRVKCAFCNNTLRNWEAGDNAMTEHKRHFPRCPFVQDQDVGNVKLHKEVKGNAATLWWSKSVKRALSSDPGEGNKLLQSIK